MDNKDKKSYIAPQMQVVSFKVEQGFVGSNFAQLLFWSTPTVDQVEDYSIRSGWTDDGSNTFF